MNIKQVVLACIFTCALGGVQPQSGEAFFETLVGKHLRSKDVVFQKLGCNNVKDALGVLQTYKAFREIKAEFIKNYNKLHDDWEKEFKALGLSEEEFLNSLDQDDHLIYGTIRAIGNIVNTAPKYEKAQLREKARDILIGGGKIIREMVTGYVRGKQGQPVSFSSGLLSLEDIKDLAALEEKVCENVQEASGFNVPGSCFMCRLDKDRYAVQLPALKQGCNECGYRAFVAALFFATCADLNVLVQCLVSQKFNECVSTLKEIVKKARESMPEQSVQLEVEELELLMGTTAVTQGEWSMPGARTVVVKLLPGAKNRDGLFVAGSHYIVECTEQVGQFEVVFLHDSISLGFCSVNDRLRALYKKSDSSCVIS